jgi:hypothetical protein
MEYDALLGELTAARKDCDDDEGVDVVVEVGDNELGRADEWKVLAVGVCNTDEGPDLVIIHVEDKAKTLERENHVLRGRVAELEAAIRTFDAVRHEEVAS